MIWIKNIIFTNKYTEKLFGSRISFLQINILKNNLDQEYHFYK